MGKIALFCLISICSFSCAKKIIEPDGTIIYMSNLAHNASNFQKIEGNTVSFIYAPPDYFVIGPKKDSKIGTWFNLTSDGYKKGKTSHIDSIPNSVKMDSAYSKNNRKWVYYYIYYTHCW